MITYEPFFRTLSEKNISEYYLINKQGIPSGTMHRLRHNKNITTKTIDALCFILDCDITDIIKYTKDTE